MRSVTPSMLLLVLLGLAALAATPGCAGGVSPEFRPLVSEQFGTVHRYTGVLRRVHEGVALTVLEVDGRDVFERGVAIKLDSLDGAVMQQVRRIAAAKTPAAAVVVVGWEELFGGGEAEDPHGRRIPDEPSQEEVFPWREGWRIRRRIHCVSVEAR